MATERVTRYVRLVIDAGGAKKGSREVKKALDDINASTQRVARQLDGLRGMLGGLFGAYALRGVADYADTWLLVSGRLRSTEGSAEAAAAKQQRLLDIANRARAPLESTAGLYTRLAVATKELGFNTSDVTEATEAVALSFRVAGASSQEAAASVLQLAQGLGSGRLQGDELRSVLENNIPLAQIIAKEFGVTVAELKGLGEAGSLTADRVLPAVIDALDELRAKSGQIPETIGGAFTVLRNQAQEFFGQLAASTGIVDALSRAIILFAKNLDVVAVFLGALALTAIPRLIAGVRALTAVIAANPLGLLAVAAATLISYLYTLKDATISFGGESARVGALVSVVWGDFVTILSTVWNWAKTLFTDFLDGLNSLYNSSADTFGGFGQFARDSVNFVIAVGKSLVDTWIGYFKAIWEAAKGAFQGISKAASAVGRSVSKALEFDFTGAREALSGAFEGFNFEGVQASVSKTAKTIGENFGRDFIGEAGGVIKEFVRNLGIADYANGVFRRASAADAAANPYDPSAVPGSGAPAASGATGGAGGAGGKGPAKEMKDIAEQTKNLREQLSDLANSAASTADIIAESMGGAIDSISGAIVDFATTGKANFRELFADISQQLLKLATNALLKQLLGAIIPGGGFSFGGGGFLGLPGFAQGGDFTVGGGGATDSQLVAFRASPGERVSVRRPDQAAPGGTPQNIKVVNVIDPQQSLDALQTAAGERVIMNAIERNPAAVRQMLNR